jgi:hypothetical protein
MLPLSEVWLNLGNDVVYFFLCHKYLFIIVELAAAKNAKGMPSIE